MLQKQHNQTFQYSTVTLGDIRRRLCLLTSVFQTDQMHAPAGSTAGVQLFLAFIAGRLVEHQADKYPQTPPNQGSLVVRTGPLRWPVHSCGEGHRHREAGKEVIYALAGRK